MRKASILAFAIAALALLLVSACTTQTAGGDAMMEKKEAGDSMMENTGDAMEKESGDAMMEKNDSESMAESGPIKELVIEAYDFGFNVSPVEIHKGDRVRLTIKVTSGFHGIGISEFGVNTGKVEAGDSKTVEFMADRAGTFPFRCNVYCGPGHQSMKGSITVLE